MLIISNIKNYTFLFLLLLVSSLSFRSSAQNRETDSLEIVLKQYDREDTIRVNLLNEIASKLYYNDLEKSLIYCNEALGLADSLDYSRGKAYSYNTLGIYYYMKGNSEQSLEYYKKSVRIYFQLRERKGISIGLNNIGNRYSELGDYSNALEFYEKAIKFTEGSEDKWHLSSTLNNIGVIYYELQDYNKALEYYQRSLPILEELNFSSENTDYIRSITNTLNNIALVYEKQERYNEALDYYNRCIKKGKEINYVTILGWAYNGKGIIKEKQEDYEKAQEFFLKGLRYREIKNDKIGIAQSCNSIGNLYIKKGQFQNGKTYLQRAYIISEKYANPLNLRQASKGLSIIYEQTGEFKTSLDYHKTYKIMNDSLINEGNIKKLTGYEINKKYEKEKQILEMEQQKNDAVNKVEKKRQKLISSIFIFGFIFMLLFAVIILYSLLQKRRSNQVLALQKKNIESKNKKLQFQNNEIQQLNEELQSANEVLYDQKKELETTLKHLKQTQTQLVQSEKMATVGILTKGVAHEINNPLNFIQGGIYSIEKYTENIKDHRSNLIPMIEIIQEGVTRASKIVKSLSSFSRMTNDITDNCDIHSIIDNCLVILHKQISTKAEIKKEYTNDLYSLVGNEGRLHQVIVNILTNSLQAIPEKGQISINTEIENNSLILVISDTGSGISKENIQKVTVPFFTTKEPGEGTGLGMSIAYNIIKDHKGNITYKSLEGEGTSVIVSLPVTPLI